MSEPYICDLDGLRVIVYAKNKTVATQIFNEKLSEHDEQIRADERAKMLMPYDVESIDELIQNVKAKALDELVRLVCKYYTMQEKAGYCADTNKMIKYRIADFAEQLKEQK